jgi:hypothetical protein
VLPQLIELWGLNVETQAEAKKNIEKLTARWQSLSSSSDVCRSGCPSQSLIWSQLES